MVGLEMVIERGTVVVGLETVIELGAVVVGLETVIELGAVVVMLETLVELEAVVVTPLLLLYPKIFIFNSAKIPTRKEIRVLFLYSM